MNFRKLGGVAVALSLAFAGMAQAQVPLPYVPNINDNDAFQDIPNGQAYIGNKYATAAQIAGYIGGLPAKANVLIAGDATQSLNQRGTVTAATTTATYMPDRWFVFSGTATSASIFVDSTAGDLPASGYGNSYKLSKTSGQTGVIPVCMAQVIETANVYQLQGQTVELDFHAMSGANFSAASGNITAYIVSGTVANEGAASMAKGINSGTLGGAAWTGQANATAAVIPISSTNGRYAAVATIPSAALEVGVAFCFTPVGTAGTNDYVSLAGIQLIRNRSLAANVNATQGFACNSSTGGLGTNAGAGQVPCSSFDRSRNNEVEALLQYRYAYVVAEGAATQVRAMCSASTANTTVQCPIRYPVPMRIAPTLTAATGFALETTTAQTALNNNTGLALSALVTGNACGVDQCLVQASNGGSSTFAVGLAVPLYDNAGSGRLTFSAEL